MMNRNNFSLAFSEFEKNYFLTKYLIKTIHFSGLEASRFVLKLSYFENLIPKKVVFL